MTDITERLAEIEARVEAADDGPWRVRGPQVDPSWKWAAGVESASLDPGEVDTTIAEVVDAPDAEFIAHARTDIPWLVEQVRELQAENKRLQQRAAFHQMRSLEDAAEVGATREQVRQRDEVLHWLISMDEPESEARRTVTLTEIIRRARIALEGDGQEEW